jgi:hypothetical protein
MALDIPIGSRVQWLANEQSAGRGTVALCWMCRGSGFDPDDPSDPCSPCRGVGAVLIDIPAREPARRPWWRALLDLI